jgi:hypothetical protein
MAQSYLIFDFGTNEEAAQQARLRLEGWRQAFRLGGKLQLKFERQQPEKAAETKDGGKPPAEAAQRLRILVRLDFSDHEHLSHHRWLERIPAEEPFKSADNKIIRHGEKEFPATAERFDALNQRGSGGNKRFESR